MKTFISAFRLILLTGFPLLAHEDCTCEKTKVIAAATAEMPKAHAGIDVGGCYGKPEPQPAPAATVGHPLKGVIVDVLTEKSAFLVKHEEIPGVMKAMTMLLKVDADTLKSSAAQKGGAITGLLVRKTDGWWLEDVAIASGK